MTSFVSVVLAVLALRLLVASANGRHGFPPLWSDETTTTRGPLPIGEHHELHVSSEVELSEIQPTRTSSDGTETEYVIMYERAHYISIHLVAFDLPETCQMTLSDPDGIHNREFYGGHDAQGAPFWAHIAGDTMRIVFHCDSAADTYSFEIDGYSSGYSEDLTIRRSNLEVGEEEGEDPFNRERQLLVCGANDKQNAVCYASSHPTEYDHARAVARLYINGVSACTGWLMGENLLMTAHHCIGSQSDVLGSEFQFMVEEDHCGATSQNCFMCDGGAVYYGLELLAFDVYLDFSVIKLQGNPGVPLGTLDIGWHSMPSLGDRIYIPQHPLAWPKELAIFDTNAAGGECQIMTLEGGPCGAPPFYNDYRYTCDTEGGSSGAPILDRGTHKVVAMHHCRAEEACDGNRGVPLIDIYDHVQPVLYPNADNCATGLGLVQINFQTDNWGLETTYQITDGNGDVIARSKSFKSNAEYTIVRCLSPGQYTLTVFDHWFRNGMCCGAGEGGYQLYQGGNLVVDSNGQFGSEEVTNFVVARPPTTPPTDNPTGTPTTPPTNSPTTPPTDSPTTPPTDYPTGTPTTSPSDHPSDTPSTPPSDHPSDTPSARPTANPTGTRPTESPTRTPTTRPTDNPTFTPPPTDNPTFITPPTDNPTGTPTTPPTDNPTGTPTTPPTDSPTTSPTDNPTDTPTTPPTDSPTTLPTDNPTGTPTTPPTDGPPPPPPKCGNRPGWKTKYNRKWKSCAWVASKRSSRCLTRGRDNSKAFIGCKASCLCKKNCFNNKTWKFKKGRKWRKCNFVAKNPRKYCGKKGKNGRYAFQACKAACSCEALS